ncbi:hypothetical protein F5Y00DRAFT_262618 [Daldinia vernicosa]|uniref:uncharacterized protein n=1 Tax=Daldinia vernicosa TaxID=114800 RepID=UPI002008E735|nr:uncharacterized protein F5Y00DRAFT_262618 [Daldinia vernicosa]KAI0848522.1 hypothetical protein F5Y00DRAFT_262618 [Daldinia vernicosa]
MITAEALDSNKPRILKSPKSITEAYDPIISVKRDHDARAQEDTAESTPRVESCKALRKSTVHFIFMQPKKWDQGGLQDILEIWKSNADLIRHMILIAPSSPCTGSSVLFETHEEVLRPFFACEFAKPAVEQFLSMPSPKIPMWISGFVQHGVVRVNKLKLFLICLICGTIFAYAKKVIEYVEVVIVITKDTDYGEMLVLVNRSALEASDRRRLMVGGSGFEDL